jgi:hypothetical protein
MQGPSAEALGGVLGAAGDLMALHPMFHDGMLQLQNMGDDPARLLTAAEVSRALGGTAQGPTPVDPTGAARFLPGRACEWRTGPPSSVRLIVQSFATGEGFDGAGLAAAGRLVPGVGDHAHLGDTVITVLRAGAGVHLVIEGMDPARREATLLQLARLAAPRVGTASLLRDVLKAHKAATRPDPEPPPASPSA